MNRILTQRDLLKVGTTDFITATIGPLITRCATGISSTVKEGSRKVWSVSYPQLTGD
jgi:hypothetical protein